MLFARPRSGPFAGSGVSLGADTLGTGSPERAPYAENWSRLFNCIANWHLYRPEEMKAVLSLGADTSHGSSPFQTLLFGNGAASKPPALAPNNGIVSNAFSVSGNLLRHTTLLMLQEKPRGMARESVSCCLFSGGYRADKVYFTEVYPLACASNMCHLSVEHPSIGEPLWQ